MMEIIHDMIYLVNFHHCWIVLKIDCPQTLFKITNYKVVWKQEQRQRKEITKLARLQFTIIFNWLS